MQIKLNTLITKTKKNKKKLVSIISTVALVAALALTACKKSDPVTVVGTYSFYSVSAEGMGITYTAEQIQALIDSPSTPDAQKVFYKQLLEYSMTINADGTFSVTESAGIGTQTITGTWAEANGVYTLTPTSIASGRPITGTFDASTKQFTMKSGEMNLVFVQK